MRIAIIIPCRNRTQSLAACLQSIQRAARHLAKVVHPGSMPALQTVVVNDRSETGFAPYISSHFPWIEVIDSAGIGPGAARNSGIRHAHADYYLFTDSDCIVDRNWLMAAHEWCLNRKTPVGQGVPWLHQMKQNPLLGRNEQELYRLLFSSYIESGVSHQIDTRNFIVAREVVELMDAALFTTSMSEAQSESRVLANKLANHSIPIAWLPQLKVYHEDPATIEISWTHKYRHGSGRRHVWNQPPLTYAAMHRYFVSPVIAGIDADYVIPAHIAFLIGYRDAIQDGSLHKSWWPELYSTLLDHFPAADRHHSTVVASLAPIKVA